MVRVPVDEVPALDERAESLGEAFREGMSRIRCPRLALVRGRGLLEAAAALRARPGVRAVAPFGAALHVRVQPGALSDADVDAALRGAGGRDVKVEPSEPSLEDVFLAVVERGGAGGAA